MKLFGAIFVTLFWFLVGSVFGYKFHDTLDLDTSLRLKSCMADLDALTIPRDER